MKKVRWWVRSSAGVVHHCCPSFTDISSAPPLYLQHQMSGCRSLAALALSEVLAVSNAAKKAVPLNTLPAADGESTLTAPVLALLALSALLLFAPKDAKVAGLGALLGFGALQQTQAALTYFGTGLGCLCPPLGAVAVLLFCLPNAPASQPRAVVVGHVASALAACAVVVAKPVLAHVVPAAIGAPGLAAVVSIVAMKAVDAVHPPGAAYAFLCVLLSVRSPSISPPPRPGAKIACVPLTPQCPRVVSIHH